MVTIKEEIYNIYSGCSIRTFLLKYIIIIYRIYKKPQVCVFLRLLTFSFPANGALKAAAVSQRLRDPLPEPVQPSGIDRIIPEGKRTVLLLIYQLQNPLPSNLLFQLLKRSQVLQALQLHLRPQGGIGRCVRPRIDQKRIS